MQQKVQNVLLEVVKSNENQKLEWKKGNKQRLKGVTVRHCADHAEGSECSGVGGHMSRGWMWERDKEAGREGKQGELSHFLSKKKKKKVSVYLQSLRKWLHGPAESSQAALTFLPAARHHTDCIIGCQHTHTHTRRSHINYLWVLLLAQYNYFPSETWNLSVSHCSAQ